MTQVSKPKKQKKKKWWQQKLQQQQRTFSTTTSFPTQNTSTNIRHQKIIRNPTEIHCRRKEEGLLNIQNSAEATL
jgi:hypothetical protein